MRKKSKKTKEKLRMGTGTGADYKPWIQVGEFGSRGTAGRVVDWKTGRSVHLMSQAEIYFWYILRWNDEILDIREQFPLELKTTEQLANEFGILHPSKNGEHVVMTTDLLVTTAKGYLAFSIKGAQALSERTIEKLYLEKQYWERKHVYWKLVTPADFNITLARNIRDVTAFYNVDYFQDTISFLKFLIARKYIQIDLSVELDWRKLCIEYKNEIEKFKNLKSSDVIETKLYS